MTSSNDQISVLLNAIGQLVPQYMAIEEDRIKANGSIAVCILDADGNVNGRIFGDDKILGRERYRIAWLKASQVWITGIRTGEYERLVFNNEIQDGKFGIKRPDLIGWEGGQPITLKDGTVLAVGVSGFRSSSDLEIAIKAVNTAGI